MKRIISYLATALLLFASASCIDEKIYDDTVIGEGEATLSAEVLFKNFTPALDGSRASGSALNGIENLYLFVYNEGGTDLIYSQVFDKNNGLTVIGGGNTDTTPSDGQYEPDNKAPLPTDKGESTGAKEGKISFTLPFGKYKIYAVANVRGEYASSLTPDKVDTDTKLKEVKFKWDANTIGNNDQMFGVFTTGALDKSPAETFDAPIITVNQTGITLRAWLTRLASKVTVAYDASGLNNGVWIYIKNVTVHDIAAECYVGQKNNPTTAAGVLNRRTGNANKPGETFTPMANTRITYPGNPTANIYDKTQSGIELYNGFVNTDGEPIAGSDHSANADALFFYENMKGNMAEDSRYDKRPQISGDDQVGENIREPNLPKDPYNGNDYQDRVPYGTYIEVEGYYVSINPNNPGSGPIKYRFMLGKDVKFDYNVQRNYHYKLTLGFKGWANQPDWHIDFDNTPPLLEVPTVYRVSYLYQQRSTLPVKVSSNCKSLRVDIIENNWAPSDPNNYDWPANPVTSTPTDYQFYWNKAAFDNYYSHITTIKTDNGTLKINDKMPYLGFLALNMPKADDVAELPVTIPVKDEKEWTSAGIPNYYSFKDRVDGQNALKTFYEENRGQGSQAYSVYNQADLAIGGENVHKSDCPLNAYSVVRLEDGTDNGDKIVMVNMWTRAKTMIEGSGFSGNNPYEYFVRKATLKVTATFDMGDDPDETRTEYLTVLQEPRIVNPKAVWRKSGSTAGPFHVLLMTTEGSNQKSNYTPLKSDGEWTASVEMGSNVTLSKSATTIGEYKDGVIYGKTGTEVDFNININSNGYAVVNVLYHNNNCVHKILVRQGYDEPTLIGGKYWSNFTLQSATATGQANVYNAVETASPFYLGSLFRRGKITQGILETNNSRNNVGMGPLENPGTNTFWLTSGNPLSWSGLGYTGTNANPTAMGTFRINNQNWKVPELADFNALKSNCEFALGVIYGEATETSRNFSTATGYSIENQDNTAYGVRGVIAYDVKGGTAAQVLFSLGKDGFGRRKNSTGMLIYSDVTIFLTGSTAASNNTFRPVPYNLKIAPGAIFWLNNRVADGFLGDVTPGATISWDVNYFNYDFNSFDNREETNYRDANVIKLVRQ